MKKIIFLYIFFISGCTGIPENVTAVQGFELNRYLGTWYEITRLDHRFERGLDNVSATYTLRKDGGVDVINKGRNRQTGKWEQAEGKAYFVGRNDEGRLKVSFFGPFYSGYNIIALDQEHYSYALVTGPNRSYLWILSRARTIPEETLSQLIERAEELGYDTQQLIFVEHEPNK